MSTAPVISGKLIGIDYRVWMTMLVTCIVSLGLLGYQRITHYHLKDRACVSGSITVNGRGQDVAICYQNRLYQFGIQTEESAKVLWNFDDGSSKVEGPLISHRFKNIGDYHISAFVNGICFIEAEIIVKKEIDIDLNKPATIQVAIFQDIVNPKVGNTVVFEGVPGIPMHVYAYEWKLFSPRNVQLQVRKDSTTSFTFSIPGKYTLQLMLNNDPGLTQKQVVEVVADLPPPGLPNGNSNVAGPSPIGQLPTLIKPEEDPFNPKNNPHPIPNSTDNKTSAKSAADSAKPAVAKPKIAINEETFKDQLQDVIDGNIEVESLYEYLDLKQNTKVEVNGDTKHLKKLRDFCEDVKRQKNNKIESVGFGKNDNNSIQIIKVKMQKKKGFLKKILGKN